MKLRTIIGVIFAAFAILTSQMGWALDTETATTAGMLIVGIGDLEITELKAMLDEQGRVWAEFTKKNDELIKAKAEGKAVAELTETIEKLNGALTKLDAEVLDMQKKASRPNIQGALTPEQEDYKKAFARYLRKGDDRGLEELQKKAMGSFSDPDGGYLIEEQMDAVIDRVVPTISAMYRMANVITIGTSRYEKLVKTSGMTMRRIAEGGAGGESTAPKYAKVTIDVATAEVEPWVYNETLDDAFINLEADLANEAAIGFAAGAGSEFITGDGVGKARGITAYTNVANSAYAWGSVGYILSKKSAAFASVAPSDQIIALQHALKAQYRPGAAWMMNDTTLGVMRQMKDQSGSYYLWQPDPLGSFGGRFLGNPVEVDDNFVDLGAGTYSLAFGNFRQAYTIVNRAGTTLIRDNITAKGTTKFNFRRRFGGGITNFEAVKLMKFATS